MTQGFARDPEAGTASNTSSYDTGNSKLYLPADGTATFVGTAFDTRNLSDSTVRRIAAQQIVLASNVASGLGGTFIFQYGPDGISWPISESRTIVNFATIRDLTLQNAGNFFRVQFIPSRALVGGEFIALDVTQWFIAPPDFVRLANQEIEEANAAMGQQFSYLKAFNAITGKSTNIRPTATGALRVADDRLSISQSGALRVTGIRDDISIHFFDSTHVGELGGIYSDGSVGGTVTADATEGRAVFAVPATANKTCIYRSEKTAVYSPGHTIRGEQTIVVSALPTGTGFIEWGFGDGINSVAWRLTSAGLFAIRRKNSILVDAIAQASWNRDRCLGDVGSQFVFNFNPQVLNVLKNNRYIQEYEWLGVAPPQFSLVSPDATPLIAHTMEFPNQNVGTTISNPELPLYIHIANDAGAQALSVSCGSWRAGTHTNNVVISGLRPDGSYADVRATGEYTFNPVPAPLGINAIWTSEVIDVRSYPSATVVITADQVSKDGGVKFQWSDTPNFATIRFQEIATFLTGNIASGYSTELKNKGSYFRLSFENNSANAQTAFYVGLILVSAPAFKDVALISATGGSTGQLDVALTVQQVPLTFPGRTSVRLKNLSSSARPLFYGFSLGLTIGNGDELAVGEAIELDLSTVGALYVICASIGGAGVRCSWTEIG